MGMTNDKSGNKKSFVIPTFIHLSFKSGSAKVGMTIDNCRNDIRGNDK